MLIHDWTRVSPGTFHNFQQRWATALCDDLNAERLPENCFAMVEQYVGRPEADVVALEVEGDIGLEVNGGGTVTAVRPQATYVLEAEEERYARMADRVAIHHGLGEVLAVIEIVSPGNKSSRHALRTFAEKAAELIRLGVNLLVVDLFPPGVRRPPGAPSADLGRDLRAAFRVAGRQAADAGRVPMRADQDGLRGTGGGGRSAARHAIVSPRPVARARALEESYETAWNVMPPPIRRLFQAPV